MMRVYESKHEAGAGSEAAVRTGLAAVARFPHLTVTQPDAFSAGARTHSTRTNWRAASPTSSEQHADQASLDAAANGSLRTDAGLTATVHRMLADPQSDTMVEHFAGQWLQLFRTLDTVTIDRTKFPEYDDALRARHEHRGDALLPRCRTVRPQCALLHR